MLKQLRTQNHDIKNMFLDGSLGWDGAMCNLLACFLFPSGPHTEQSAEKKELVQLAEKLACPRTLSLQLAVYTRRKASLTVNTFLAAKADNLKSLVKVS